MTADALQSLFERFRLRAQTFFTGNLCAVASFDQPKDHGHLHLVRAGKGEIRYLGGRKALKIQGPGLLFYPRNLPHHLVPEGPEGLDLVCATITFGIGVGCPLALGLPEVMHLGVEQVGPLAELIFQEAFASAEGKQAVVDRLCEVVLVHFVRQALAGDRAQAGLLAGLVHPQLGQVGLPRRLVEQAQQAHAVLVVDRRHRVGVADVVDPGHVLVADALDAVVTEAVVEQGGALDGFGGDGLDASVEGLEVVPGGDGARAACGADVAGQASLLGLDAIEDVFRGGARDVVVPDGITELLELIEDQVLGVVLQLPALVVDFFHIALAAGGGDHFGADLGQPGEALLAHVLGQDGDSSAAQHG